MADTWSDGSIRKLKEVFKGFCPHCGGRQIVIENNRPLCPDVGRLHCKNCKTLFMEEGQEILKD